MPILDGGTGWRRALPQRSVACTGELRRHSWLAVRGSRQDMHKGIGQLEEQRR